MNFEKEYIYNFQNSDETECKVINKIKIGDNEKGTYDVLVEYKIEEEKTGEDLYISALEFETKKLIPGKSSALVTENNVLEELLKGTENEIEGVRNRKKANEYDNFSEREKKHIEKIITTKSGKKLAIPKDDKIPVGCNFSKFLWYVPIGKNVELYENDYEVIKDVEKIIKSRKK